jgi:hypothetical protein
MPRELTGDAPPVPGPMTIAEGAQSVKNDTSDTVSGKKLAHNRFVWMGFVVSDFKFQGSYAGNRGSRTKTLEGALPVH